MIATAVIGIMACQHDYSKEQQKADNFYREAVGYDESFNYIKAIESLKSAIALDSAMQRNDSLLRSNVLLSNIQLKIGRFQAALSTLEQSLRLIDSDSLSQKEATLKKQAQVYKTIHQSQKAIKLYESCSLLSLEDKVELAELYQKTGNTIKAFRLYKTLSAAKDIRLEMHGYAGLMEIWTRPPVSKPTRENINALVKKIITLAKRLEGSSLHARDKYRIYSQAAYALSRVENQRRNGSFFMFKALAQAKLTNDDMLKRKVAFEANALVVRRAQNIEIALNYFKQRNYVEGMVYAYALLGMEKSYSSVQRIEYLKKGLSLYQEYVFQGLPKVVNESIFDGFYQLSALLLKQNRFLEAYEVTEAIKMIEQRQMLNSLNLMAIPAGFKQDVLELKTYYHIISALQQLKDRTAFLVSEDQKVRRNLLSRELSKYQGFYYSKLSDLRKNQRNLAEIFQPMPITLPSLQSLLPEGVAAADIFYSNDQVTVIFIARNKANIFQARLAKETLTEAIDELKWDFIENEDARADELWTNVYRRQLSRVFVAGLEKELEDIERLIIFSNIEAPFHLLGRDAYLQEKVAISYLTSAKQLQLAAQNPSARYVEFIKPEQIKHVPLDFFLKQREKVLIWHDLRGQKLAEQKIVFELALSKSNSIADMLHKLAKENIRQNNLSWIGYSAYGY